MTVKLAGQRQQMVPLEITVKQEPLTEEQQRTLIVAARLDYRGDYPKRLAEIFEITPKGVKNRMTALYYKLSVYDAGSAVCVALNSGAIRLQGLRPMTEPWFSTLFGRLSEPETNFMVDFFASALKNRSTEASVIASQQGDSLATIRGYTRRIYQKTGIVQNRPQLATLAFAYVSREPKAIELARLLVS